MGYLLKEALKTLCGVNRWSYAVFWKIGSQNPKLLIWEDCYFEPNLCSTLTQDSGIDCSEKTLEEWEGCQLTAELRTPQVGDQEEDKVPSLVNRMMLDNRVKVVGQGLIGRAAFTGNHLWILSENCARETHPPEVQNEVYQQFSAGIRTVAVIPVLTHGVVQLGSSLDIMENMAFVTDVKSLILQLGCIPGALLSDCYTSKEPASRIGVPIFFKNSVSADPSGDNKLKDSVPSVGDRCNQQSIPSQAFELVGQLSHSSIRHKQNNLEGTSTFRTPKLDPNVVKSQDSLCLPNNIPVMMPSFPFSSQLENEKTEAETILLNPELWLNQQTSLYNQRSGFDEQLRVGSTSANYSNLRILEERMLSDTVLHEDFNSSLSTSGGIMMSQLRTNGAMRSSVQLNSGASTHPKSMLNSCTLPTVHRSASIDIFCTHLTGSGLNAGSSKTEASTSDLTDHLMSNALLLGSSDFRHHSKNDKCSQIELAQRRERIENDLFQALNIPLVHLDEHTNMSDDMSCLEHNCHRHDYGNQSPRSEYAQNEDKGVQPSSGDDLFDIFGVDFKNKLFDGSWNNFLNDGPDASTKTLNKSNFTSSNLQDGDSELYSGIACTADNDHLLDAVVNRVHTAAKQTSDDSVSCKTTLTSSSVPNASPSYGRVNVADPMQGVLSGLPKSLAKLAAAGSYSFKSECSKEDAGNYSHTSSICGSQISSWEQGHSMKHSNCASTAYSKRPDDVSKSNRKRLKPGENPRPRPKDRQMIQDRMKELREIVPNGAKLKDSVPSVGDRCNQQSIPSQAFELVGQLSHSSIRHKQNNLEGTSTFRTPKLDPNVVKSQDSLCLPNNIPVMMPSFPFSSQLENEKTEAETILLNPELWLNQQTSLYNQRSGFDEQLRVGSTSANYSNLRILEERMLSDTVLHEDFNSSLSTSGGIMMSQLRTNGAMRSSVQLNSGASTHPKSMLNSCTLPTVHRSASIDIFCTHLTGSGLNAGSSKTEASTSDLTDHLMSNALLLGSSDFRHHSKNDKCSQIELAQRRERIENDLFQALNIPLVHLDEHTNMSDDMSCLEHNCHRYDYGNQSPRSEYAQNEDKGVQPSSGDDLFDIFGVDFKNKLFDGSWNNFLNDGPDASTKTLNKSNLTSSNLQDGDSELYSGIACTADNDHLLDAVVNRVHTAAKQTSDDSVSCKTTLTSSSVPNASPSYGRVNVADPMQGVLSGLPKSLAKLAAAGSYSFKSECSKEDAGNYSHTSSICGSQISSWEQDHSVKHSSSASTAYSKRPDDVSKSNRKRLKPGENPRPRPKDRQMIQDRMKELREIVPNGAKCSIDALLERTIKHMLFLQSVTKHAEKLKQTGDSKIINKDGGRLLKNNIEGGRTWAYEVGSQSTVCPIIVEDLNPPRQMLVEMLCEERGLFLEIADIIRGLGLTILKGVMETRNDKIWAQFAVEANRDVTRMEIFVSLVHLLEQTVQSSSAAGNGIENDNRMIHQSFHQAASIPVTGRPM
ncbi:Transcription factor LHW like [Actinidia chinensis var. chinensis]|uniref:Transcription factor LHW like n=1 Tax=Actinidia chinensis var. chinensis TaxID=1590841 RepID=A0A2R6PQV2_ACTCC|nr:Transcription factor LHW like [Actinidia chinensis var. chinensis]